MEKSDLRFLLTCIGIMIAMYSLADYVDENSGIMPSVWNEVASESDSAPQGGMNRPSIWVRSLNTDSWRNPIYYGWNRVTSFDEYCLWKYYGVENYWDFNIMIQDQIENAGSLECLDDY